VGHKTRVTCTVVTDSARCYSTSKQQQTPFNCESHFSTC